MQKYEIYYTERAQQDIERIYEYIAYEVLSPHTAVKYFNEILDNIDKLKTVGSSFAYSQNAFLVSEYGADVRTIKYKKITVVYKIIKNSVIIIRIMAGALIK
ncbi:MAG: type II toxin-antitoxin system RelE/ParE family toxin [Prevotellaceae bacterium]|jgi:plasmid stabilization system protein ParE|nr:type II toxin-antitoxin system RelE/ParE family toxin [Prevotellaceae bacterium]